MKYEICTLGGGYGWEELWFDEENSQFSIKQYHCGSVDMCEEHYDGEETIDTSAALEKLIKKNKCNSSAGAELS